MEGNPGFARGPQQQLQPWGMQQQQVGQVQQQCQRQQQRPITRKLSLMDVKKSRWYVDELVVATGRNHHPEQQQQHQQQEEQEGGELQVPGTASVADDVHQVGNGMQGGAMLAGQVAQQQQMVNAGYQQQQQQGWQGQRVGGGGGGGGGGAGHEYVVPTDGVARHGFSLGSCYGAVLGVEPEYTSSHNRFFGTLDYIWYTAGNVEAGSGSGSGGERGRGAVLRPRSVLLPPPAGQHVPWGQHMPNGSIPSDHISLVVDMELFRS